METTNVNTNEHFQSNQPIDQASTRPRQIRSSKKWQRLLEQWRNSGLSIANFAKRQRVSKSSLYKHLSQSSILGYYKQNKASLTPSPKFLPVKINNTQAKAKHITSSNNTTIEIIFSKGPSVRINSETFDHTLITVLRAIESLSQC